MQKKYIISVGAVVAAAIFFMLIANNSRTVVVAGGTKNGTSSDPTTSTSSPSGTIAGNVPTGNPSSTGTVPILNVPINPALMTTGASGTVDVAAYNAKLISIANLPPPKIIKVVVGTSTTSTITKVIPTPSLWPVTTVIPNAGALLPFNRIVAYYGNLYSKQMGVLGQYPGPQMLSMLASTTAMWAAADPSTPVIPALDYIAVAAQAGAGSDGKYRLEMPDSQIDQIMTMAAQIHGIVFLDIQVGLSTVQAEVPQFEKYLAMPNVELSLDPEFDMHNGARPGTVIGTMDASEINWAAQYLANLVQQNNLPPKLLVVHRFTDDMVTNYKKIQPLPSVQIVMDMDGFGFPAKKINTYAQVIVPEPVQFTGFKLFYKNDAAGPLGHLMTPAEVLKLSPQPSYIQYQ